jgi:hypothetical protein
MKASFTPMISVQKNFDTNPRMELGIFMGSYSWLPGTKRDPKGFEKPLGSLWYGEVLDQVSGAGQNLAKASIPVASPGSS